MLFSRRRIASIALVAFATAAIVSLLHAFYFDPLRKAELYSRDLRIVIGRKAPLDPRLVFPRDR
jgi:hypothetical protein